MKGIVLAGGSGSRLYPLTLGMSKQLLPVYNKPMVYYPLSILMLAGIRDLLIISTPEDQPQFIRLLGDGSQWGMNFSFAAQDQPRGIADAFLVGKEFIGSDTVSLILGDNILYGDGLWKKMTEAADLSLGARIFAYHVQDPKGYGVVEFDENYKVLSLEEKPQNPRTNYAVPGLYFYDNEVVEIAASLAPSARGELEITDVNHVYLKREQLTVSVFGRGVAWLDAGTHPSLIQAANFVQSVEERQGLMISCPEEIAYRMGLIDAEQLHRLASLMASNRYGEYLLNLLA
ncbi:MAG: glucose-1-phosphate thymidylyltransferase RfbA [Anaerolineales bacterium]|uniref:Glucose-1-phosphate thymidylyltransferase n=1 Tax=Candidatus Desulfolinea nitratireducens TaxID=2841698 RepID=A0A8J6NH50_9CHLR|nr:glucose-1-phosphate thymidylyltransferase RfbA [Candidatus Desulfolinea nitratireducens]